MQIQKATYKGIKEHMSTFKYIFKLCESIYFHFLCLLILMWSVENNADKS